MKRSCIVNYGRHLHGANGLDVMDQHVDDGGFVTLRLINGPLNLLGGLGGDLIGGFLGRTCKGGLFLIVLEFLLLTIFGDFGVCLGSGLLETAIALYAGGFDELFCLLFGLEEGLNGFGGLFGGHFAGVFGVLVAS